MKFDLHSFDLPDDFEFAENPAPQQNAPLLSVWMSHELDLWEPPSETALPSVWEAESDPEMLIPCKDAPAAWTTYPSDPVHPTVSVQLRQSLSKLTSTEPPADMKQEIKKDLQKDTKSASIGALSQQLERTLPLRVCQGVFYWYREPIWCALDDAELLQKIRTDRQLEKILFSIGNNGIRLLLNLLRTSPVITIAPEQFNCNKSLINLLDGVMDLETGRIHAASPEYLFTTVINVSRYEIEESRSTGAFDRIVQNAFGNDRNKRQLLLEIIGTILSPSLPKKFFAFVGDSNTGKSKLGEFIKCLVGDQCSLNLENGPQSLREKFTLGDFPGKLLAFCFEMQDLPLDAKTVAKIKQITGDGSLLSGEKKYGARLQFTNSAKLLFCSNHPLRLGNGMEDSAFWNRLVLLPFEHSIPENQQDPFLLDRLNEERGWIVRQALEAYRQLAARKFVFTSVSIPAQYQHHTVISPCKSHVEAFVKTACTVCPGKRLRIEELYEAYTNFCIQSSLPAFDKMRFSSVLVTCIPSSVRRCKMDGGNSRGIEGIDLIGECPQ